MSIDDVINYPGLRRALLTSAAPVMPILGKIQVPMRRLVTYSDVTDLHRVLLPGMVILSRKRGQFSNNIIPGEWKHASIYCGDKGDTERVVEAVYPKVRDRELIWWATAEDYLMVLKPTFATVDEMRLAANFAWSLRGKPYDLLLDYDHARGVNKAFYCSEVIWWSYNQVFLAAGKKSPFTPRETLGVATVSPQDFADAHDKWTQVWSKPRDGVPVLTAA